MNFDTQLCKQAVLTVLTMGGQTPNVEDVISVY